MSEKDKMLAGELYLADSDKELIAERSKCKNLCREYNVLRPDQIEERKALIKNILGKTGEKFWIEQHFWCNYGYNI